MTLPHDPVFWIRAILFAAIIASMATAIVATWGKPADIDWPKL
jgi:hypothetical protein